MMIGQSHTVADEKKVRNKFVNRFFSRLRTFDSKITGLVVAAMSRARARLLLLALLPLFISDAGSSWCGQLLNSFAHRAVLQSLLK